MDEKQIRRRMRTDIGSYGWALMIYYFLMNVCVIAAVLLDMVFRMVGDIAAGNYSTNVEMDEQAILGNGWGYLIACVLAVLFIWLWKGKTFFAGMWRTGRDMKQGDFWRLLCLFISGQLVFQICAPIQEMVLNMFGLSVLESMEAASVNSDTISMFLYLSLGAPVVEEIIFRGLVLRGLEPYGKRFAILISAILFGLFHGNIVQSPYAFVVGLVLGYVAMEYNILWAMVLHMINNLVLGDTFARLTQWMGETGSGLVIQVVILVCAVFAVVTLIRRRRQIGEYLQENAFDWRCWWSFCTAPGIIVMILLMEINAFLMLLQ